MGVLHRTISSGCDALFALRRYLVGAVQSPTRLPE